MGARISDWVRLKKTLRLFTPALPKRHFWHRPTSGVGKQSEKYFSPSLSRFSWETFLNLLTAETNSVWTIKITDEFYNADS